MRRALTLASFSLIAALAGAAPVLACGGLVAPNGTVRLLRTSTLAAYHDGVEHYITSFEFAGGGAELGSIVPLPGVPTTVERGGEWTLQRLQQETQRDEALASDSGASVAGAAAPRPAEVLLETRIDALDLTVLRGGAAAVGQWAKEHGFLLTPDAPEVLEFYARRSPIFLAARFDAQAAGARGQGVGDGTPIHITIPTRNPWVPLRILALGRGPDEPVQADVYLLTNRRPALLPRLGAGFVRDFDAVASPQLLSDLRSDKGMDWVPASMWLTKLVVSQSSRTLDFDLAVDASGRGKPSLLMTGALPSPADQEVDNDGLEVGPAAAVAGGVLVLAGLAWALAAFRR